MKPTKLRKMDRHTSCLFLALLLIGASCQDDSTTAPDDTTAKDNAVAKETGICRVCVCKDGKVNCKDQKLGTFFKLEQWAELTDINPTIVDLSDNVITNITIMADLPIEELNLSNNKIENIENASFRDLQEMRVLDLSYNRLTSKLSPHAFEGKFSAEEYEPLSSMRTLNLAYNQFHSLNQDLFEHLPELTSLDLTGNPLTTIDHVTLIAISSLPMLKDLRLRSCQLTEIPDKFLHTPRYLEYLDLSDNKLTMVPQELEETKNLVYLNLNQNPIVELDMDKEEALGFPMLRKLQELHMCNMPELRRIGTGALAGLKTLSKLHISFNPKLAEIAPKALARPDDQGENYVWPLVKELYLQSNNLTEVDRRFLSRWEMVEKLDVSDNPWLCDCSTQWMVDDLVTYVERRATNESEKLVCQEPIEMRGLTMKQLHDKKSHMRCVDKYGNRPERDGAILLGTLIGVLLAVPIMLSLMLLWRRGYFGWLGFRGPVNVSRAFYKRAPADDNYI
ncbi:leucine-rich repeat neuronal protein 3-like [Cydia splendana]|uniref:leucine-rich repeat neuronal protein 3-like n=1 Tax=Cydia splendana TaxID=1100963 RepID=UPI0028F4B8CA